MKNGGKRHCENQIASPDGSIRHLEMTGKKDWAQTFGRGIRPQNMIFFHK
jgi:hypothetical protein